MTPAHQLHDNRRASRFRLAETTPAVLQFEDARLTQGELQVISRTGGLLFLNKAVELGSVVTFMFRTHKGLIFATVEMLLPVSSNQQPFRFLELKEDDKLRMQAAFESGIYRNIQEEEMIEEFRAAIANWDPPSPRRHFLKPALAAVTFAILCVSVIYVLGAHIR